MSLGGDNPPPAQPASAVAGQQQQYNTNAGVASQAGSNTNQNNAFGSVNYTQTGTGPSGVPIYTANTTLSNPQQTILSALQSGAGSLLTNANYGSTDPATTVGNSTSGLTKDLLNTETSYLQPFFTGETNELDTKLRNQGLNPSPSATSDPSTWGPYEKAMNQLEQSHGQTVTGYLAQAEPQAYQQSLSNYLLPLTTASTAIGLEQPVGGSVTSNLAPTNALNIQPANYTGAVAQEENINEQNYQQQMAQQNALMNGLFKLGTAGVGLATGNPFAAAGAMGGFGGNGSGGGYQIVGFDSAGNPNYGKV